MQEYKVTPTNVQDSGKKEDTHAQISYQGFSLLCSIYIGDYISCPKNKTIIVALKCCKELQHFMST